MKSLQRGTIDGMVTSWAAFEPYKFQEVAFYHVEVPIGSKPKHVHDVAQEVQVAAAGRTQGTRRQLRRGNRARSGEAFCRASGTRPRRRSPSFPITRSSRCRRRSLQRWQQKLNPIVVDWAKERPGADKAVETFRQIYAKVKAGH